MNAIEADLYPILFEDGIRLDVLRVEDAEEYFSFVKQERAYLEKYDIYYKGFQSVADVRKALHQIQSLREQGRSLTCAIWHRDVFIGFINGGIKHDNTIRIGFAIASYYQGLGIVTRGVRALLHYAFEAVGVQSAWLVSWVDNASSIRVAERLGFKPDKVRIPADLKAGIPSERIMYRLPRSRLRTMEG